MRSRSLGVLLLLLSCGGASPSAGDASLPADDTVSVSDAGTRVDPTGCRHRVQFMFELKSPRRTTVELSYRVREARDRAQGAMYGASIGGIDLAPGEARTVDDQALSPVPSPGTYVVSITVTRQGATVLPWSDVATFTFPSFGDGMVPSDGVPPLEANCAVLDGRVHFIDGHNEARGVNQLILYTWTPAKQTTETNEHGTEAQVVGGKVLSVVDREQNDPGSTAIPTNGYVLSAHGDAAWWWLNPFAKKDAEVILLK